MATLKRVEARMMNTLLAKRQDIVTNGAAAINRRNGAKLTGIRLK